MQGLNSKSCMRNRCWLSDMNAITLYSSENLDYMDAPKDKKGLNIDKCWKLPKIWVFLWVKYRDLKHKYWYLAIRMP